MPLGVLQAGRIAFNPESLPASKRETIREARMGVFNKIFLKFAAVFWDKDYELIDYYGKLGLPDLLRRRSDLPILPSTVHGAFLSGVRAAYEIMLADSKEDLMENSSEPIDLYVRSCPG